MTCLRLWLAAVWLIFAAIAPAHAAIMTHNTNDQMATCDQMAMPHMPTHPMSNHGDDVMPCCSIPAAITSVFEVPLLERVTTRIKLPQMPVRQLIGVDPFSDPHPPKNLEA